MNKTVKEVKAFGDPVQLQHGTYYNIAVTFEDGSKGIALAKSQDPWYKPGSEAIVEVTGKTPKGFDKVKIKKPDQQGGGGYASRASGGSQKVSYNSDGARVGMCVSKALETVLPMLTANVKDNVEFFDTMGMDLVRQRATSLIALCKELEEGKAHAEEKPQAPKSEPNPFGDDEDEVPF